MTDGNNFLFNQDDVDNDQEDYVEINPDQEYFKELVGEDKRYKTPESLAKSVLEKDRFIEQLKKENNGLRDELSTSMTMQEFLDQTRKVAKPSENGTTPQNQEGEKDGQKEKPKQTMELTEEKLAELVARKVNEVEVSRIQENNLASVKKELVEKLGPKYVPVLAKIGSEFGMSQEEMNVFAAQRPKAFMKLIEASVPKEQQQQSQKEGGDGLFTMPRSNQQASRPQVGEQTDRKKSYYDNLKQKDKVRYWSPQVQNQMHRDAQRLGPEFFDT